MFNNRLNKDSFLISETDLKGRITFANEDFCKYAEYSVEELIGKPHNIVRHPDMPSEAFKDLWDTIKRGEVWEGVVKNKSKSGKSYWVYAVITKFTNTEGNEGYISCRRMASEEEIMNSGVKVD